MEDESDLNQSHVEYLQHQDSPGRNLDWDSFVEGSNHFQNIMAEVNLPDLSFGDLDTTRDTLNSEMTTEEALEDRLRRDPAGFRTLCKRTIKIMINAVPSPENIHNIRSHHMQQIVRKMEKGLSKLANYMNVLEFFLTDECEDISDEEARSLELLHSQLSKTQEELFASEKKLRDILKGLHAEEEKISSLSRMSLGAIAKTSSPQGQVGQGVQEQVSRDQPGLQISTAPPTSSVLTTTWQDRQSGRNQPPQASGLMLSEQQLRSITEQLQQQYLSPPSTHDSVPKSSASPEVVTSEPHTGQYVTVQTSSSTMPVVSNTSPVLSTTCESWRNTRISPTRILDRLILEGMRKIGDIIDNKIDENLKDAELQSLDNRESKQLQKVQKELMDNLMKLESSAQITPAMERLQTFALAAYEDSCEWQVALNNLIKKRELWSSASKSLGTPLKLEPYDGWKSSISVYEFLKMFHIITRNVNEKDAVEYLFNNYLSKDLQDAVRHCRHDLKKAEALLIKKYGDISRIIEEKKKLIRGLTTPNRNNKTQEVKYYRALAEILDQLQNLVESSGDSFPDQNERFTTTVLPMIWSSCSQIS